MKPSLVLTASLFLAALPAPEPSLPRAAEWPLKGGLVGGGFVPNAAQNAWPKWAQDLIGHRLQASKEDLRQADLALVPDAQIVTALERLRARGVFLPHHLRHITAVQHAAPAVAFQKAKTAYQKAYLEASVLPVEDPLTCSRVLTQLVLEGHRDTVRQALQRKPFPAGDPALQAAFRGMLEAAPSREGVLDTGRSIHASLHMLVNLRHPGDPAPLLERFRGTWAFDKAAYHAVTKGWISLRHPLVTAASEQPRPAAPEAWFMVRPVERQSDLLWLRLVEALQQNEHTTAASLCRTLLERAPESFHAGHAAALLAQLNPGASLPAPALRVPADLTVFNAPLLARNLKPFLPAWTGDQEPLAKQKRFDLLMLRSKPDQDPEGFLRAAYAAHQTELIARYMAAERRFDPNTMAAAYPLALAPTLQRLIQEEGVGDLVDVAFVLAMMKNESLFQPIATSPAQAFGLLQLLRPTFKAMMGKQADIHDPITNIRGGLRYYARVAQTANLRSDPAVVRHTYILAGYHAGEGRARRWKQAVEDICHRRTDPAAMILRLEGLPISSTRQYATRVLGDAIIFRALLKS